MVEITLANGERIVAVLLVLVWGAGFGAVPVAAQMGMAQTMPRSGRRRAGTVCLGIAGFFGRRFGRRRLLCNTYGTVGPLLTATIVAGLGSAAIGGRTAAVDRLEVVGGPAEASSPNAATSVCKLQSPGSQDQREVRRDAWTVDVLD